MIPEINKNIMDIPEAESIFINQIVYDKKKNGEYVYTFSLGEAFFDIPKFEILDKDFERGYHYSSSMGNLKLREKISNIYNKKYGANVSADNNILISAGSKIIIYMLLKAIISQGEEVLVPEPAWLSYKEQIKLVGGVHVGIPYNKSIKEWEHYITDKTKCIIINNPNNPSGYVYTKDELNYILDLAYKHNIFILSDEAYSDFLINNSDFITFASIDTKMEHSLIVNSLSKNLGVSGWRIGYAITNNLLIKQLLKLNQHLITCAPTILQDYLALHFDDILKVTIPQAHEVAIKRRKVQALLENLGIKSMGGAATFYFLLDVSSFLGTTEELVYELLLNHNIATVPGQAYGISCKDFIRFGIGTESIENIEHCLKIIKQYLSLKYYNNEQIKKQMLEYRK